MFAALSVVAVIFGGLMAADANATHSAVANAAQDQAKAEYIVQHSSSQPPTL